MFSSVLPRSLGQEESGGGGGVENSASRGDGLTFSPAAHSPPVAEHREGGTQRGGRRKPRGQSVGRSGIGTGERDSTLAEIAEDDGQKREGGTGRRKYGWSAAMREKAVRGTTKHIKSM